MQNGRLSEQDIRQLVDVKEGVTSAAIYSDPAVYELEMEQIFARTWLLLGFESQVADPGDFVTSYMGEDAVVMSRQLDGSLAVWLNQCSHRGSIVCRADRGNSPSFVCPYHGWCFDMSGQLVSVPREQEAYFNELDKEQWGLVRVPRVESYKGMVFGCWDPEVRSLEDYLGDVRYYLDAFIDYEEGGMEVATILKWTTPANWKWQAEQHATDMFHAFISHVSLFASSAPGNPPPAAAIYETPGDGYQFSSNGHGGGFFMQSGAVGAKSEETAQYRAETRDAAEARLGAIRAGGLGGMHITVFPHMSLQVESNYIRVWHPRGPNETEVWSFIVVDKNAPQEVKNDLVRKAVRTFSVSGLAEQDDVENVAMCQRGVRGYMSRHSQLNIQRGKGHLLSHNEFPGTLANLWSEQGARGYYDRWQGLLLGEDV